MAEERKAIRDYTAPTAYSAPSCIVLAESTGAYEIKTSIMNALSSFYGLPKENPYHHIRDFLELCEMQRFTNITTDQQRLRLFPYFTEGQGQGVAPCIAREHYQYLGPDVEDLLVEILSGSEDQCSSERDDAVYSVQWRVFPRVLGAVQESLCAVSSPRVLDLAESTTLLRRITTRVQEYGGFGSWRESCGKDSR